MSRSKRAFSAQELAAAQWYAAPGDTDGPQVAFMADGYVVWRHGGDPQAPVLVFDRGSGRRSRRAPPQGSSRIWWAIAWPLR